MKYIWEIEILEDNSYRLQTPSKEVFGIGSSDDARDAMMRSYNATLRSWTRNAWKVEEIVGTDNKIEVEAKPPDKDSKGFFLTIESAQMAEIKRLVRNGKCDNVTQFIRQAVQDKLERDV